MTYQHNVYKAVAQMDRKTRQVVMLYDGAIRYCQQAKAAIETNNIQERYNSLTKACDIITGLQLCLDFESGGDVAKLLYDYYSGLDMSLLMVHTNNDVNLVNSCIDNLKKMREAWVEVDEKQANAVSDEINDIELGAKGLGYIAESDSVDTSEILTYGSGNSAVSHYPAGISDKLPNLSATA
jgi:flagellar secretion chaperone FliS